MNSGLAIRGVPIDSAASLTASDIADSAFASSQALFEARRGPGTPLLPDLPGRAGESPAPYLRAMLARLLRAAAVGETVDLSDENDLRVYMELRLALVEVLALRAEADDVVPVPATATAPTIPNLLAIPVAEPSWLPELVVRSLVRTLDASEAAARVDPPDQAGAPPHLRLARESAYWRSVPPHGAEISQLAERKSDSLAGAVRRGEVLSPREAVPLPLAPRREPDWIGTARSLLARPGQSEVRPPPPSSDGLTAAALAHFRRGSSPPAPPAGTEPRVLTPGTAEAVLREIDVMRSYGIQLL